MTEALFAEDSLTEAFAALRNDLIAPNGPQISTMRNYRFAIVPYAPSEEFKLRPKACVFPAPPPAKTPSARAPDSPASNNPPPVPSRYVRAPNPMPPLSPYEIPSL